MKAVSLIAFHFKKRFNVFQMLTICTLWARALGITAFPVLYLRHNMTLSPDFPDIPMTLSKG